MNQSALIQKLVDTHGEGGVCPTRTDWERIFELGEATPIHILNLLKFLPQTDSAESRSGAEAYAAYSRTTAAAFIDAGAEVVFRGSGGHRFGMGSLGKWDFAIVTRYPSAEALAGMWLDARFIAAHEHRIDGVEASEVVVFAA